MRPPKQKKWRQRKEVIPYKRIGRGKMSFSESIIYLELENDVPDYVI